MTEENRQKKPLTIIIIIGIIIILSVIVIFVFGISGIFKILGTIVAIALFLGLIFGLAYLFYHLFIKKHRFDVTYVNKQKLIEAGKINNQKGLLKDLYISGDEAHSRIRLGKIVGYCRIQILRRIVKYDEKKQIQYKTPVRNKDPQIDYDMDKEEQDVFVVSKGGIASFFSDPLVIRVSPNDHDSLIGDVTLKGFSIVPHGEYWFLNKDHLDVTKIDFAILKEAERGIMFEMLRDTKSIVDKSMGLDSSHRKEIEKTNLVDIPEQVK